MKKQYIIPASEAVAIGLESQILAGSMVVSDDELSGSDALSNSAGGWSSENWSGGEEE